MKIKIKYLKIVLALLIITSVSSCKKDVPIDKALYIGTWSNYNGTIINIESNGKASYEKYSESSSGSRTTTKSKTIKGHVNFTSGGFKITNGIFGQNISVSLEPILVENSTNGYISVFDGEEFYR